jgi:hypothetical protein
MAVNRTPVGPEGTQIGSIEELMAMPERRVKRQGERAVIVRSSGAIEADWIIEKFDPETGVATVSKRDERGHLLKKEIPREEFLATNFFKSEEMVGALNKEQKRINMMGFQGLRRGQETRVKEMARLEKIRESFRAGDLGPMRDFFAEPLARLEGEARAAEKAREDDRRRLIKEMRDQDQYLVKLEGRLAIEKDSSQRWLLGDEIARAKDWKTSLMLKFEELKNPLPSSPEFDRLRWFVEILDQETETRRKRVGA